jgi:uncharacterized phage protein gp47/JayE
MGYPLQTLTNLQAEVLSGIVTSGITSGTIPLPKSPIRDFALAQAGLAYELQGYLDWISQMAVPFTAENNYLEAWAGLKNIFRKPATAASGNVLVTGTPSGVVPSGTLFTRGDNYQYQTSVATALITSGLTASAMVPVTCLTLGAAGTCAPNTALTITLPITNVSGSTLSQTGWVGGVDQELDADLRTRMLQKYQSPPQGGSIADYDSWALSVPGVTRAWAVGSGSGIVTVFVMFDNSESAYQGAPQGTNGVAATETRFGFPIATGDQLTVVNYIDMVRPVTALVYVSGPVFSPVNFVIGNLSNSNSSDIAAITSAMQDLFRNIGSALGGSVYPGQTAAALLNAASNPTYYIVSPTTPIVTLQGYLPICGTITGTLA